MKNKLLLIAASCIILFSSCGSKAFLLIARGESFDALTKISDEGKICFSPNGGDNGKDLVFSAKEDGGFYNIYMKNNVLSKALIQKTSGDNYNLSPNYCAANDKVAFQFFTRTNFDIYYINASEGKAITQVTNTDENEYNPSWSNDGKKIVFEKGSAPKSYVVYKKKGKVQTTTQVKVTENQIWIKNIETGELKMIGQGSYPKFSPDDNKIVFVKYNLNRKKTAETGTIWTMSVSGDNQQQLTNTDLGYASHPAWSPDAKNIVFQLTKKDKKDSDIYTIGSNGDNLKQHTLNKSQDFAPYWSTDDKIYFSSDRSAKPGNYIIWRFKINVS